MKNDDRVCAFDGCDRPLRALGLCSRHYMMQHKGEQLRPLRPYTKSSEKNEACSYGDCARPTHCRNLCVTHYEMVADGKQLRSIGTPRRGRYNDLGHKLCWGCKEYLPDENFPRKTGGLLAGRCKPCTRDLKAQQVYGMKPGAWREMFAAQGEVCAICKSAKSGGFGWHTDHDHACCPGSKACGKCIRGILCARCNSTLGYAEDSPSILRSMASYLEANNKELTNP